MSEGSSKELIRKVLSRNIDTLALFFCQKPLCGYALQSKIEDAFDVHIGSGLIYGSLMRLKRDELLSHRFVIGKCKTRQTCSYTTNEKGRAYLHQNVQILSRFFMIVKNGKECDK